MATPSAAAAAVAAIKPPFTLGKREVFLPAFSVILHRTGHLGPKYATFTVPLWFNKLDLRDYLYNVYDVRILSVRSYVKMQPLGNGLDLYLRGESYNRPQQGRHRRLKSIKRMTVELEQPFQWPDPPQNQDAWEGEHFEQARQEQKEFEKRLGSTKDAYVDKARNKSIKEQAKALLEGKLLWTPPEASNPGPKVG